MWTESDYAPKFFYLVAVQDWKRVGGHVERGGFPMGQTCAYSFVQTKLEASSVLPEPLYLAT